MALFFPIASGIAAALTVALTYETGQNAKRKLTKRRARKNKDL